MYFCSSGVEVLPLPCRAVASSHISTVCVGSVCLWDAVQSFILMKFPLVLVSLSDRGITIWPVGGFHCAKSGIKAPIFGTHGFLCVCTTQLLTVLKFVRGKKHIPFRGGEIMLTQNNRI